MLALQVMPGMTLTGSATDNAVVRLDGTTGLNLQSSNVTIADTGLMTLAQLDDSVGLKITGYDDKSSSYGLIHIDSSGNLNIDAKTSGNYLNLKGSYIDLDVANLVYIAGGALRIYDDVPIQFGTDADYSIGYNSVDDTLRIADGSDLTTTPRIILDSNSKVGIGTTPVSVLSVRFAGDTVSGVDLTNSSNNNYYTHVLATNAGDHPYFSMYDSTQTIVARFASMPGQKSYINFSTGLFGIGTTNPSELLDVSGGNVRIEGDTGSGYGYSLYIEDELGADSLRLYAATGTALISGAGGISIIATDTALIRSGAGQSMLFDAGGTFTWRDNDDSYATRMSLDSATGILSLPLVYDHDMNGETMRDLQINDSGELGYDSSALRGKIIRDDIAINTSWIYNLKPTMYSPKKNMDKTRLGLIADDVAIIDYKYINNYIFYDSYGEIAGIHYNELITPILSEIQNHEKEIVVLKKKIEKLEKKARRN